MAHSSDEVMFDGFIMPSFKGPDNIKIIQKTQKIYDLRLKFLCRYSDRHGGALSLDAFICQAVFLAIIDFKPSVHIYNTKAVSVLAALLCQDFIRLPRAHAHAVVCNGQHDIVI